MTKIGEYPIQRSDGDYDYINIHQYNTIDSPVMVQLSTGQWAHLEVSPLGDGDTGLIIQSSDGSWYQGSSQATDVIEDWESGTYDNWDNVSGTNITSSRTWEGNYALEGVSGNGNQSVRSLQTEDDSLSRYQHVGETARVYGYFDEVPDNSQGNAFIRWAFGGTWEDSSNPAFYTHWNINDQSLSIFNSNGHDRLTRTFDFSYPGHQWWAVETDWGQNEITARLINYSNPSSPIVEAEVTTTDTTVNNNDHLGHYWFVWNSSSYNLYSDYAVITDPN